MANLVVVAPPFLGHVNPMRALARALVRRGHSATFVGLSDLGPLVIDGELGFRPVGLDSHPPGHLAGMLRRMALADRPLGLFGIIRDVADMTAMLVRDLPAAAKALAADLIICDGTEAAGGLVAAGIGLPVVTIHNALPLNREPGVPPPFTGWRYDPTRWGLERNRGGYRVADLLMRRHEAVIARAAEAWHLGPRRTVADCLSPYAQISQIVAGLDFPRWDLPVAFHHVGPLREPRPAGEVGATPAEPGGGPLAFASLGTLQGGRFGLFRRIAAGVGRAGFRLVLAHGGGLTAAQAAALSSPTVSVHAFVPQETVLARANLAILNGGLNTVLDSLAQGVPVLALPIAFEQGAIAARLERSGAGVTLSHRFASAGRLGRAAARLVTEVSFRQNAGRLAAEIAAAGGVERAADIVEAVLRTGAPVASPEVASPVS